MEEQSQSRYLEASEEKLLRATKTEYIQNGKNGETNIQLKHRMRHEHLEHNS